MGCPCFHSLTCSLREELSSYLLSFPSIRDSYWLLPFSLPNRSPPFWVLWEGPNFPPSSARPSGFKPISIAYPITLSPVLALGMALDPKWSDQSGLQWSAGHAGTWTHLCLVSTSHFRCSHCGKLEAARREEGLYHVVTKEQIHPEEAEPRNGSLSFESWVTLCLDPHELVHSPYCLSLFGVVLFHLEHWTF